MIITKMFLLSKMFGGRLRNDYNNYYISTSKSQPANKSDEVVLLRQ